MTGVCVQPPALHKRCFRKEEASKLYLTSLWLTVLICQESNNSIELSRLLPLQTTAPSGAKC